MKAFNLHSDKNPTYTNDVKIILDLNCSTNGCHSMAAHKNGIKLHDYSNAKFTFLRHDKIVSAINHAKGAKKMPKGKPKLSQKNIETLELWIENGCPE